MQYKVAQVIKLGAIEHYCQLNDDNNGETKKLPFLKEVRMALNIFFSAQVSFYSTGITNYKTQCAQKQTRKRKYNAHKAFEIVFKFCHKHNGDNVGLFRYISPYSLKFYVLIIIEYKARTHTIVLYFTMSLWQSYLFNAHNFPMKRLSSLLF